MATYSQTNDLESILSSNIKGIFPGKKYIGYYWLSDKTEPFLVDGEFNPKLVGNNPFIIEANLYAADGSVSVSVEHIDGKYLIGIVDWKQVDNTIVLEEQSYLTHRLKETKGAEDYGKARFVRAWIPVKDPECADMEVLQPAWRVFKGFEK